MSLTRLHHFEDSCRRRKESPGGTNSQKSDQSQSTSKTNPSMDKDGLQVPNAGLVPATFSDVDCNKYWNILQRFNVSQSGDDPSGKFGNHEEDFKRPSLQVLSKCKYFRKATESPAAPIPPVAKPEEEENTPEVEMDIYDVVNSATALDLSQNGYVYALKHLSLAGRGLDSISLQANFCNLLSLDISDNELQSIKSLGALPYLKYLTASKNFITVFLGLRPAPIALSVVDFSCNKISDFLNLTEFWTLTKINLSYNEISNLENFVSFKHLHSLNLSHNKISQVADFNMPSLLVLDLSCNSLEKIVGLEKCKNLRYLDVSGNMINELTPIKFLTELIELNVSRNQLGDMLDIECLKTMIELTDLAIHTNPLTNVENSRVLLIHMLPQLLKLDGSDVTPKDLQLAKDVFDPSFRKLAYLDQIDMIVTQASQHADTVFNRFKNFQRLPPLLLLVGSPRSRRHRLAVLLKEKFHDKICLGGLLMVPLQNEEFPRDLDIPISLDSFNEMKTKGEFLATAKILGHTCGFACSQISRACAKGAVLVASVSLSIAITLRNFNPKIVLVLPTDPPTFPDLDEKIATIERVNMENEMAAAEADAEEPGSPEEEEREHRISFDAELSLIPLEKIAKKVQKFIDEVVEVKNLDGDVEGLEDNPEEEEDDEALFQPILKQPRRESRKAHEETKVIFAVMDKRSLDSIIDAESTFFPKLKANEVPHMESKNPSSTAAATIDSTQVEVSESEIVEGEAWKDVEFEKDEEEYDHGEIDENDTEEYSTIKAGRESVSSFVKFKIPRPYSGDKNSIQRKATGFHRKISFDDDDDDDDDEEQIPEEEFGDNNRNDFEDVNFADELAGEVEETVEVEEEAEGQGEHEDELTEKKKRKSSLRNPDAVHEPVKFVQTHETLTPHKPSYDPRTHKEELTKAILSMRDQYVIFHQDNPGFFCAVLDSSDICESYHNLLNVAQECIDKCSNDTSHWNTSTNVNSYGEHSKEHEKIFLQHRLKELRAQSETWCRGLDLGKPIQSVPQSTEKCRLNSP